MRSVESDDIARLLHHRCSAEGSLLLRGAMQRVKGNNICDSCDIAVSCRFAIFSTSDDAQRHCFLFSPGLQFFLVSPILDAKYIRIP